MARKTKQVTASPSFFDKYAHEYDHMTDTRSRIKYHRKEIQSLVHDYKPQTVLDAGCGNGYMSKLFSGKVAAPGKVYALDPDSRAISVLKEEIQGSNIEAMEGDITVETPIEEQSIDLIYLSTVFHGFSGKQLPGFFKEVNRLLKTDGLLAIVEFKKRETL